ncbi:NADP-dependent malic enzyme [Candidatus Peregrinibacteria bacterium]|nr:NADP-dependent malic enzyme [Candidatus Peregrinibacteria bacterium]
MTSPLDEKALDLHKKLKGKMETTLKSPIESKEDLSLLYTPGVAAPCLEIAKDKEKVYTYTGKGNLVMIVTDGTAVLGLGDIGPEAALPVMEGKAALFKRFGNVDAISICLNTKDVDEIVETVVRISPGFGGVNLEDISAPRCFEIEKKLRERLNIAVFHDDQHGTAIVVLAALQNALKVAQKKLSDVKIVFSGAGAAGIAVAKLLISGGAKNLILCDSQGIISSSRTDINSAKKEMLQKTNPENISGTLADALKNADVFIGVSKPNLLTAENIKSMNLNSIIFAMANPTPEIMPDEAKKGGAFIVATGRSDFPNQVNNVLAFPGLFRGVFDSGAKEITEKMKIAAANALSALVPMPTTEKILPSAFDEGVAESVAKAVSKCAEI